MAKCEVCSKEFDKTKSMTNHRRWHTLPQFLEFQNNFRIKSRQAKIRLRVI